MSLADILAFVRDRPLAVEASRASGAAPQAAVVGIVVSDEFEVFFDTLATSRKAANLERDGRISLVVGWDMQDARTVQLEGVADTPEGADLSRLLASYLRRFPDGAERQRLPDITYVRVRPTWLRMSDFRAAQPVVSEVIPIGTTWNEGRRVLETRLSGTVNDADVAAWKGGLAREVARIPDGTRFKLLADLRRFEPTTTDVHRSMREVVPRLMADHGMEPAFVDLFDDRPTLAIRKVRDLECVGFAHVHHDEDRMADYRSRISRRNQDFFTHRANAEMWLDALPG